MRLPEEELSNSYFVFIEKETSTNITFSFQTENGEEYIVAFIQAKHFFNSICSCCQSIFELTFSPLSDVKPQFNIKIRNTIIKIIKLFMDSCNCPILYVCADDDNKKDCRLRLFQKWFNVNNIYSTFRHDYRIVDFIDYTLNIGIISKIDDEDFDTYFAEIDYNNH